MTSEPSRLRYVLFPGRHHLLTRFQARYLTRLVTGELTGASAPTVDASQPPSIVWAVTSANHSNTKRNPVAYSRREAAIERFSAAEQLRSLVVPIVDVPKTDRFAAVTVNTANAALNATLDPTNTIVACSTPAVADLYAALGFAIAGVEADVHPAPARPWDVLELLLGGDSSWEQLAHPASVDVFDRYGLVEQIRTVVADPVVGAEGGLTDTRSYRTYIASFEAAATRKWEQAAPFVEPGRIVDIGCATGAMLELAALDPRLDESDLYGVEVARHLYEECQHKKAQGVFANPNTFFYQRNILTGPVLPDRSVNTTLTFALTHEIYSYGGGIEALRQFVTTIYQHTAPGGVWINSDVCGPDDPDRVVQLAFDTVPTPAAPVPLETMSSSAQHSTVAALSPADRLVQFAADFARHTAQPFEVHWDGTVAQLQQRQALEFLSKASYVDNWLSETHEQFCALTWADWVELVERVGFDVDVRSGPWTNEWVTANLFAPLAQLRDTSAAALPWPTTHLLLVARRPLLEKAGA